MAYRDDWRSERSRTGPFFDYDGNVDHWRSAPRDSDFATNYAADREAYLDVGFQRRGWRPGSDYYGNDPDRFGNGNVHSGRYNGQRDDRGAWENSDIDYSGRSAGAPLNRSTIDGKTRIETRRDGDRGLRAGRRDSTKASSGAAVQKVIGNRTSQGSRH